jgi:hypothetical protein
MHGCRVDRLLSCTVTVRTRSHLIMLRHASRQTQTPSDLRTNPSTNHRPFYYKLMISSFTPDIQSVISPPLDRMSMLSWMASRRSVALNSHPVLYALSVLSIASEGGRALTNLIDTHGPPGSRNWHVSEALANTPNVFFT